MVRHTMERSSLTLTLVRSTMGLNVDNQNWLAGNGVVEVLHRRDLECNGFGERNVAISTDHGKSLKEPYVTQPRRATAM